MKLIGIKKILFVCAFMFFSIPLFCSPFHLHDTINRPPMACASFFDGEGKWELNGINNWLTNHGESAIGSNFHILGFEFYAVHPKKHIMFGIDLLGTNSIHTPGHVFSSFGIGGILGYEIIGRQRCQLYVLSRIDFLDTYVFHFDNLPTKLSSNSLTSTDNLQEDCNSVKPEIKYCYSFRFNHKKEKVGGTNHNFLLLGAAAGFDYVFNERGWLYGHYTVSGASGRDANHFQGMVMNEIPGMENKIEPYLSLSIGIGFN